MKRIEAFLKGKVADLKAENRKRKVYSSLNAAKINFEEQRDDASLKIDELVESLADCTSVNEVIQEISNQIEAKEEAERGIERIKNIEKYLNEEVEVKDEM